MTPPQACHWGVRGIQTICLTHPYEPPPAVCSIGLAALRATLDEQARVIARLTEENNNLREVINDYHLMEKEALSPEPKEAG